MSPAGKSDPIFVATIAPVLFSYLTTVHGLKKDYEGIKYNNNYICNSFFCQIFPAHLNAVTPQARIDVQPCNNPALLKL